MSEPVVILVTASSEAEAKSIARTLLEQKLIACANLLPINSLFHWEGEIQEEAEVLMIMKSESAIFKEKIIAAVQAAHSYDVPEIIAMPIVLGSADYLKWISDTIHDD
jgi:periplasmic divalent cation tolerance protein